MTHTLQIDPALAQPTIDAGLLLVPCDPQPTAGAGFLESGDMYGWMDFNDNPDGLIIRIKPCPYKVGDVRVRRLLREMRGKSNDHSRLLRHNPRR